MNLEPVTAILAIDPGLSGAVARFYPNEKRLTILRDFKAPSDVAAAIKILAPDVNYAVMELVHAMPGQGVCSMFSFGRAAGVADGALCLALPHLTCEQVSPQRWQNDYRKWYDLARPWQFDSRALATKLFPDYAHYFTRKKDHNSADAALIAFWKSRQLSQLAP